MLPLLGGKNNEQFPVIPGSSLKGALRSQAERIMRTLFNIDPGWLKETKPRERFLAQLDEGSGKKTPPMRLIQQIFGGRGKKEAHFGQGALSVADCFAAGGASADQWGRLYFGGSNEETYQDFTKRLADTRKVTWQKAHHVAIDRWTNGPLEHALYSVLEPIGEKWNCMELELDLSRIQDASSQEDATAAWVLTLLVLRDLMQQRIPIGFGGNRGLGEIKVNEIRIQPVDCEELNLTESITLQNGTLENIPDEVRANWNDSWKAWLEAEEIK